jgi:hypothetical protein
LSCLPLAQVLLVGDSAVGKSCLLMRFTADRFDEVTTSTIGEPRHMLIASSVCCLQQQQSRFADVACMQVWISGSSTLQSTANG